MQRTKRAPLRRTLASLLTGALVASAAALGVAVPAQAAEADVSEATLSWGVKQSFRNYVVNLVTQDGLIETNGNASQPGGGINPFEWTGGNGSYDTETGAADVAFSGGVHFTKHGGQLDIQFSNPRVEISGASGTLYLDVVAAAYGASPAVDETGVAFATLAGASPAIVGEVATWTNVAATLTAEGAAAFAGFYNAGEALDPLTFSLPYTVPAPEPVGTTTTLAVSPDAPAEVGADVTLTATVDPAAEGTVVFRNGETELGSAGVDGGVAAYTTNALPAGTASLTAEFVPSDAAAYNGSTSGAVAYEIVEAPVVPEPVEPSLTVTPSAGLDPDGATVTVVGEGFDTSAVGLYGPTAGQPAGFYAQIGWIADEWRPSEGAASSARSNAYSVWVQGASNESPYLQWTLNEDGTADFVWEVEIDQAALDAVEIEGGTLAVFTTGGGGVVQAVNELAVPITFAEPAPVEPTEPTATIGNADASVVQGDVLEVFGAGFREGETVTATVTPGAIELGTGTADAAGDVTISWIVPADLAVGEYEISLSSLLSGTATAAFTVTAAPAGGGDDDEVKNVVANGSLVWGVKQSFRNYVVGPIATGAITTSGAVSQAAENGPFTWTGGTGTYEDGTGTVSYTGSVNFRGHGGVLDLTLSDPVLHITGPSTGVIVLDVAGTDIDGNDISATGVEFADVTFDLTREGDIVTLTGTSSSLTAAGAGAFAGFYQPGESLDLIAAAFALTTEGVEPPQVPTPTPPAGGEEPQPTPGPGSGPGAGQATPTGSTAESCVARSVSGATLDWGVRASFRDYITGSIAKGSISGGWGTGSGAYSTETNRGSVSYGGSIQYTGHSGLLDITLSSPRIQVNSATSATLFLDVQSKGYGSHGDVNASGVAFATLSLPAASASGGAVGWSGASATLTAAGADAFMGFYDAGEALDSVSFTFPLGAEVECDSTTEGSLAATGGESAAGTLWLGAGLLALGALLVAIRRRQGATA